MPQVDPDYDWDNFWDAVGCLVIFLLPFVTLAIIYWLMTRIVVK